MCLLKEEERKQHQGLQKDRNPSPPQKWTEFSLSSEGVKSPLSQQALSLGRGSNFWAWWLQVSTMKDPSKGQKNGGELLGGALPVGLQLKSMTVNLLSKDEEQRRANQL